jgi:hypothetical protein
MTFAERYTEGKWTVTASGEVVGVDCALESARRGCLNDMGRTLTIRDPIGRIAAIFRDGRDVNEEA